MNNIKLSVVIPAYNESKNLGFGVLDKVDEYLKKQDYTYEVLIVDDGSTDNTAELISEQIKNKKNFSLMKNPHGGKAITVLTGLLESHGEIAVFTDMDQATPLCEIEKFFPKFEEGYDGVIGSRSGRKGAPLMRQIFALGFVVLRTIILGLPFQDTQCGFKAFDRKAIEKIVPPLLKRWQKARSQKAAVNAGFDVEMLFTAKKSGLKIAEAPVAWKYVGSERVGIHSAIEALIDMLRIRINSFQGRYA